MNLKQMLIERTNEFFERHWSDNQNCPTWNFDWQWRGAVPNYLLPGLYALFKDEELVYIGLGRGGAERGLSARLESHVLKIEKCGNDKWYVPQPKWAELGVNQLATIGFPTDYGYLAPALEDYLIERLNPPANRVGRNIRC